MESLGKRLSDLRKEHGYTQNDIAEKLNISPQAVSKWENDQTSPDIDSLIKLANIYHVSVDELVDNKKEETIVLEPNEKKDINKMMLKIRINSNEGDKVVVNFPLVVAKLLVDANIPGSLNISGYDLSGIDFKQVFALVEQGVIGEIVSIDSSDGDHITIVVE